MSNTSTPKPRFTFAFVLLQKFSMFSLSALLEPLRIANYCSGRNLYGWRFLSADGKDVQASTGVMVQTQAVAMDDSAWDAIIVCGGWNAERYDCAELFRWLQYKGRSGIILGAIETGSYILASAGLLHGYCATIHWHCHNAFKERYPLIDLKDALYVIDRKRMTCAGGTAGLDMMLLEAVGPEEYRTEMQAVLKYILDGQLENGSWYYPNRDGKGDTSITQYAMLGLWSAARADIDIPMDVWDRAAMWHVRTQLNDGGFAYHPSPGGSGTMKRTMTAAAVGSLHIARMHLFPNRELATTKKKKRKLGLRKFRFLVPIDLDNPNSRTKQKNKRPKPAGNPTTRLSAIDEAIKRGIARLAGD
ncbi:MAG: DJ-1/PfpI family protein, partial [Proteobacteria bacterium]|nr:DJ-1/PfpI family protein [Pseudomonadota bacterium]